MERRVSGKLSWQCRLCTLLVIVPWLLWKTPFKSVIATSELLLVLFVGCGCKVWVGCNGGLKDMCLCRTAAVLALLTGSSLRFGSLLLEQKMEAPVTLCWYPV
jgi:hypothetical protein